MRQLFRQEAIEGRARVAWEADRSNGPSRTSTRWVRLSLRMRRCPSAPTPPIVRTNTAVKDVGAAVDFILKRRGVANINLLGGSWGTSIMGWYTAQNNDKVNKLVLYAPGRLRSSPSLTDSGDKLGACRNVSMASAKARWLTGVPEGKKASLIPAGWFEAWADATIATDPVGPKMNPHMLRAPNGVVQDTREYWGAGKPLYDPVFG